MTSVTDYISEYCDLTLDITKHIYDSSIPFQYQGSAMVLPARSHTGTVKWNVAITYVISYICAFPVIIMSTEGKSVYDLKHVLLLLITYFYTRNGLNDRVMWKEPFIVTNLKKITEALKFPWALWCVLASFSSLSLYCFDSLSSPHFQPQAAVQWKGLIKTTGHYMPSTRS